MSQIGFDEGSLFDALSKDKIKEERFTYNKDGTVKKKRTITYTYWDLVMAIGGPTLLFMIIGIIKRLATTVPGWFDEEETRLIKEHPLAFLAMGPIGFKLAYNKAKAAGKVAEFGEIMVTTGWKDQILENWGLQSETGYLPQPGPGTCREYWGVPSGPLQQYQIEECQRRGLY